MHSRLNPLIGSYRQQSPLPLALKLVRSQVRSIGLVMRLTECQADTDIIITTTNALVSLPIVALVTVLLVAFIISVLFHLYLRSPRVNPLSNTETSVKRRFEHSNESLMARSIASIFGPGAGPQGVQFSFRGSASFDTSWRWKRLRTPCRTMAPDGRQPLACRTRSPNAQTPIRIQLEQPRRRGQRPSLSVSA